MELPLPRSNEVAIWHFNSLIVCVLFLHLHIVKKKKYTSLLSFLLGKFCYVCFICCKWRYLLLLYSSSFYNLSWMLHLGIPSSIPILIISLLLLIITEWIKEKCYLWASNDSITYDLETNHDFVGVHNNLRLQDFFPRLTWATLYICVCTYACVSTRSQSWVWQWKDRIFSVKF